MTYVVPGFALQTTVILEDLTSNSTDIGPEAAPMHRRDDHEIS